MESLEAILGIQGELKANVVDDVKWQLWRTLGAFRLGGPGILLGASSLAPHV